MLKLPVSRKKFKFLLISALFISVSALLFLFYQRQKNLDAMVLSFEESLAQRKEQFGHCYYEERRETYEALVAGWEAALAEKDLELLEQSRMELDGLLQAVSEENAILFQKKVKRLKKADISNAYDNERKRIAQLESDIQEKIENCHFTSIPPLLEEWATLIGNMSFVADNLSIYVNQVDASHYPLVDLYLSIHDIQKDQVPSYLVKNYFYLAEAAEPGASSKVEASHMEQLDGNEALNLSIVTDLAGCQPKKDKKMLQSSLDGLFKLAQFDVGDQVELMACQGGVSIASPFTSHRQALADALAELTKSKGPSYLYDGLFAALNRSALNPGAKCIIALTDGEDAKSSHTWEEVVELSLEYEIPIYMIGIGKEISPYVLEWIGTKTNGFYRNIHDFSSLGEVFEAIYARQKSLYRIRYKSSLEEKPYQCRSLEIAYQNRLFGGSCSFSYTPSILRSASPTHGEMGQEKGESLAASPSQAAIHCLEADHGQMDSLTLLCYKITKERYNKSKTRCKIIIKGIYASPEESQPYQLATAELACTLERKDGAWLVSSSTLR